MTKKLFKNSFIYVAGDIINKAVPFLLLPLLTKYLTPSDYGMVASFGAFVSFLSIFIGLSLHGAVNVAFFNLKQKELQVYIVNALLLLGISASFSFIVIFFYDIEISEKLLLDREWIYIGVLVSISQFVTLFNTTLWIAEENPKAYTLYQLLQTVLTTALTVLLVVGYGFAWEGQVIALIIGTISFALISMVILQKRKYLSLKYNKEYIKDLLSFGIPMIPHQLAGWIQTSGDKILVVTLLGTSATGLFVVGYQIGAIMSVLTAAFHKVWAPYLYKLLSSNPGKEEKEKIVKLTYLYIISVLLLVGILYLFSLFLFTYIIDDKFVEAQKFVIYILLAYALDGMYLMVVDYLFFTKKTSILASITFSMSILHVTMSYFFISSYGAIGAAYAQVISMLLTLLFVWYASSKVYTMPWSLNVR